MPKRPFKLTAPVVLEHPRQKQICDVLTLEIARPGRVSQHGVVWYAIDHANFAGEVPGVRVERGIIAGILDTFVLYRGQTHLIEVKTDTGVLSDHQMWMIAACTAAGAKIGVVRDAMETLVCLDTWGVPRANRIRIG